jgi:TonB family protein
MIKIYFLSSFLFILNFVSAQINCSDLNAEYSGYCYEFNPNETISFIKEFKNGKATGVWMQFDSKGKLIKQLNTETRKDSLAQIYPIRMKKHYDEIPPDIEFVKLPDFDPLKDSLERANQIFEIVDEPAVFVGGTTELMKWIVKNLEYPTIAMEEGLQGRVYIKFIVEKDGSVSSPKVMRGIQDCPMCDKEAIRLVKSMPKWTPAIHDGRIVRSYMIIPIKFSLD